MAEIKGKKMIRAEKVSGNDVVHQVMTAMVANTIREIVKIANEEEIKREDIVSLLKQNEQFVLVYYK